MHSVVANNLPDTVEDHSGVVVLPDLPPACQAVWDTHNRLVLADYVKYVHACAMDQIAQNTAARMPMSGAEFNAHEAVDANSSWIMEQLFTSSIEFAACSPFVATSGQGV